jgi:uncharacterized protein (DUF1330 family)
MAAYWCARVHVTDKDRYDKYVALAGPAIEKHGGQFLARGGKQVILEGGPFERSIVARFPSLEQAVACYNSPEYTHARSFAEGAAERHMVVVQGVDEDAA